MVASSLDLAKELIKECLHDRDATRANNGILIGSGKIEHLQRDEGEAIHAYERGVNRGMQICRSAPFFAKSVDPPKFLF